MKLYSIMPLDTNHIDEICDDILYQYKEGITTCALFMMTLVPEGTPPVNKAADLSEKYMMYKKRLDESGVPNGVLVQASIGHGWTLGEPSPFQTYRGFSNGIETTTHCPYDEGFREYIYDAFRTIAKTKPSHIMVDDDLRLLSYRFLGCGCPLHMKRFNELAGTNFTREELFKNLSENGENSKKYSEIFVETQRESLVDAAKVMRKAIDSVDKTIPGSFCAVGEETEFASEIAKILAGEGNPTMVRINNARYCAPTNKTFSLVFLKGAVQIAKLKNDGIDYILAETDTCPQNRYSTSAYSLHNQFTGSLLEGANGAKHWITRLGVYEPESGKAYRKVLAKYKGFYQKVSELAGDVSWTGFRMPINTKTEYKFNKVTYFHENAWLTKALERFGLPVYFSEKSGGLTCLDSNVESLMSDREILDSLKCGAMLSSSSAKNLIERGFGEYIGVEIGTWNGLTPTSDQVLHNNAYIGVQENLLKLTPLSDDVQIDSYTCNTVDQKHYTQLFPSTVVYKNSLGGTCITFAGSPDTEYSIVNFSFLNYTRKEQIKSYLKLTGNLISYYPGDEEVYYKCGYLPDGKVLSCLFNLSYDPIEGIEIGYEKQVKSVKMLSPDGKFEDVNFSQNDGIIKTDAMSYPYQPVIFTIE